jgi:hypothetical protein
MCVCHEEHDVEFKGVLLCSCERGADGSMCKCLRQSEKSKSHLNGILAFLARKHGRDHGLVAITARESFPVSDSSDRSPKNAADLMSRSIYASGYSEDQWLCYDFQDMRLTVM